MREEMVSFPAGDRTLEGFLVLPEAEAPRPSVLLLHEIWGLDAHIRDVARRFARAGYVTLAPDLYTGEWREVMRPENIMAGMAFLRQAPPEVQRDPRRLEAELAARTPEEQVALRTLMQVTSPQQRSTFAAELVGAVDYLRSRPEVDPDQVASLGFCMGGGLAIHVACLTPHLAKTVIFYGENPPLERVPDIRARVLGLYGGRDRAMEEAGKSFTYKVYGGAQHAFFNDTRPMYHEQAAKDAWEEVLRFLAA
jgi:carboxymethylenebutenolidase